ncbi:TonB-dependent receptor [Candidatus Phycosocius spiralis]|uniref:TonB-dependent receptor n=1 Tax=Candidatus Phycosocius spiralis TaxID=2815099 RepID=A0ABQ4PTE1_9PROT|nr:TonB-dependent receptor [Candidatus Phycosocius spiralis]GIU66263.1 TonB-dependent receptor [Candidatus Phycosocius spiralis]
MTKNTISRRLLWASVSAFACLVAGPALAVGAPTPEDEPALGLDVIVVTAQKRETNQQTTPIAMSVLGGEQLKARRIESLADLMNGSIPSLRVAPFFSRSSALTVGIRGIVPFDANQPSRDAGVGVYIDGVYLGRSQGLGAALMDIERIEVLKGPQGTLFGRNSTGGAVSIVTRKPSGKFGVRQTVGMRNFGGYLSETHLDLEEVNNVSVKLDAVFTGRDGTVENTLQGEEDFNKYERRGVHLGVRWQASEAITAQYDYDISKDITTPYYVQLIEKNPAAPALAPLVKEQRGRARETDIGVPQEDNVGNISGHVVHINWQAAPSIDVRSITSFRTVDQTQLDNGIGAHSGPFRPSGNFARYSLASLRQEQFSQEFQILGSMDRLTYVAGTYFYHEKGDDDAWTPNTMTWNATGTAATRIPSLQAGAATPFPDRASTAKADSFAVFGQATYAPAAFKDQLHLTAGARYTKDKKRGVLTKVNGADTTFSFNTSSDRIDPMVTVSYDATDTVHVYAKWGTAYRAGGANSRSVNYRAFDPEEVETSEIGVKSEWLDRRARINLAAYSTKYKDIQIDFSAVNLLNSNRGTLETVNAPGKGTIEGYEADLLFAPIEGLTLSASYAYTNGKLPRAANPFNNNALQNVFIVYTPKNAINFAVDYQRQALGALFKAHLDLSQADGYRSSSGEATLTDSSSVLNGRLALSEINVGKGAKLQLSLWSRNMLDEEHTFYESRASYAFIGTFGMYNEPMTYGLDATVSF